MMQLCLPAQQIHEGLVVVCSHCDPRAPIFFLSYAHSELFVRHTESKPELDVDRFFDDLSENVNALTGRRPGAGGADPGFVDIDMPGSTAWLPEILAKLAYCHTLVALLSPAYLQSEWCQMEWRAFAQRRVERRDASGSQQHTAVFPVTWVPVAEGSLPAAVRRVQKFAPEKKYAGLYHENGIYGLLRISQDAYNVTVWQLAKQIAHSYQSYHVAPLIVDPKDL